jgi:hypothetical protein
MQRKISCLLLACFESLLVRLRKQPGLYLWSASAIIVLNENQNRHFYLEYFLREFCTRTQPCERGQETSIRDIVVSGFHFSLLQATEREVLSLPCQS